MTKEFKKFIRKHVNMPYAEICNMWAARHNPQHRVTKWRNHYSYAGAIKRQQREGLAPQIEKYPYNGELI